MNWQLLSQQVRFVASGTTAVVLRMNFNNHKEVNMFLFFLAEFMYSADDVVGGCPSCVEGADCGDECEAEDFVEQEVEDECG